MSPIRRFGLALAASLALALAAAAALPLAGCGGGGESSEQSAAQGLSAYLAQVEPIRLGVNKLLDGADPITEAYADGEIGPAEAQRRMKALERRFAGYMVGVAAIEPVPEEIRAAQHAYAHTYILEDSYLNALAQALPDRDFAGLPDTEDRQREAIIGWRTRLQVVADRLGVRLPEDIQIAGRGEIRPAPTGD